MRRSMATTLVSAAFLYAIFPSAPAVSLSTSGSPDIATGLVDCLAFVLDGSPVPWPSEACCGNVCNSPELICQAVEEASRLGFTVSIKRTLGLPAACSLDAPQIHCHLSVAPAATPPAAAPSSSPGPFWVPPSSPLTPKSSAASSPSPLSRPKSSPSPPPSLPKLPSCPSSSPSPSSESPLTPRLSPRASPSPMLSRSPPPPLPPQLPSSPAHSRTPFSSASPSDPSPPAKSPLVPQLPSSTPPPLPSPSPSTPTKSPLMPRLSPRPTPSLSPPIPSSSPDQQLTPARSPPSPETNAGASPTMLPQLPSSSAPLASGNEQAEAPEPAGLLSFRAIPWLIVLSVAVIGLALIVLLLGASLLIKRNRVGCKVA